MYKIFYLILSLYILYTNSKRFLNNKKKINIAYSLNYKYINYLYTSLYSLLENSDNNTIYNIYIQIGSKFPKDKTDIISKLETIYYNCFIYFIEISTEFSKLVKGNIDESTYYRLKLPISCSNINRIIYIDSDTLILKDLTELFTLNFDKKYILGSLDKLVNELDKLGINTSTYINAGILLMDLYSLRKYNFPEKIQKYISTYRAIKYYNHHDQTIINYVCHDKIGIFRPKYHMWPFKDIDEALQLNNKLRTKYDENELIEDYHHPFILHYPGGFKYKKEYNNTKYFLLYNSYAEKANKTRNNK